MKKKLGLIITLVSSLMILSACSKTKSLDEKENAVIAQYIAGSVLKFDTNYNEGLVYAYQQKPTDKNEDKSGQDTSTSADDNKEKKDPVVTPDVTKEDTEQTNSTKTEVNAEDSKEKTSNCKISDLYGKNLNVSYKDYKLCTSYNGDYSDEAFNVQAKSGNQLLVLRFTLKNTTKKSQKVKFIRSGISYELKIGEVSYYPKLSIASNDIQYFNTTIKSNKSKSAVLIFEIPKKQKVNSSILTITNIDKVSQVTVK